MKILVLNSGSSSLKFKLFSMADLTLLASGLIEEIATETSRASLRYVQSSRMETEEKISRSLPVPDHRAAIALMADMLRESGMLVDVEKLAGIGHRVVHGGESFREPVRIDGTVIAGIEELIPLAPLHNPANLMGIRVTMDHAPDTVQVAVFDTAFHHSLPEHAYLYAIPHRFYREQKVRRYGFHGTSHAYVAREAAKYLARPLNSLNIITLHLGNGASAAAIRKGKCIDTSMGMTPLEGLVMGTRSGDLDPAILFYLHRECGMDLEALDDLLNQESGLKGLCGKSDMRSISEAAQQGDSKSLTALTIFCYRIKKYIGAYLAALGGADCIVFTGGIGENSAIVRQICCEEMERLNISIDPEKNRSRRAGIAAIESREGSIPILVIATDEEYEIARQTKKLIDRS